jgi:FtsP/CotA-like multicopper oxidase with cupredoxin domain
MDRTRRNFLQGAAILGAGVLGTRTVAAQEDEQSEHGKMQAPAGTNMDQHETQRQEETQKRLPARRSGFLPVITPDIPDLPYKMENGVKVFHLIAEPVKRQLVPFKMMEVWGYNGSCPGPTIQANQGDRVRILFDNHLPESTTIHWHGLEIPIEMDGLLYVTQKPVPPGGRFVYEFTLHQQGTYFYHSHGAMQEMMGMIGMFILHPEKPYKPRVDHDYGIILQEWAILPDNTVPNTANMEFNWLTFNGVSAPATTPLIARLGSRVRIRLVNLGMDHHPIHLHCNQFVVTGTEAGRAPESTWRSENTVLVGVAQARDIEFDAKYAGDWMLHCHLPHHMMNSMSDLLLNGAVVQDRMIMTAATNDPQALSQMQTLADAVGFEHVHHAPIAPDANSVPGFPQDAFMDMGMDEAVVKPETYGLPGNWSANMMGMMTLVRVLPTAKYDQIMALKQRGLETKPMGKPAPEHLHR